MGLRNKIFNKETKQIVTTQGHQENWDFYFNNVDKIIGSFFIDLGLIKIAPIKDKTNLIWISISMNNPKEDGLSSNEESQTLFEIEDNLVKNIKTKHKAIYVGRLTSNSKRELYFYSGDTTLYDKTISESTVKYPMYEYDYTLKDDKDWDTYQEFLYPTPQQFQCIQNRHVVEQLEKEGDKLIKEREVDHWIYFKSESDRTEFLELIKNDGFTIIYNGYDKTYEYPYSLQIKRIDKVDQNSVDEYVIYLWKAANDCNGDYDGWETSVEKD